MSGASEDAPAVSVLLPVYNCEAYLPTALASLEAQTLRDFEIIAIDDGSIDGSGALLDARAAHDLRYRIIHQANGGIVAALNRGLSMARGRAVARMDGDDIARADRLERQLAFLDAEPDVVAVGSILRLIDSEGRVTQSQRPPSSSRQTDLSRFPPFVRTVPHPTLMARREAMVALGGYRPFFPHAEDHDLLLRLAMLGRIELLGEYLLDYRVHGAAVSDRNRLIQLDSMLKAQAAAVARAVSGADAFADGTDHPFDALIAGVGMPPAIAWKALRRLRQLEQDINRDDAGAACRRLGELAGMMLRDAVGLAGARALAGLAAEAGRNAVRTLRLTRWC
jgi:glycosyltransferase involved in cell wall biosynthesis